MFAVILECVSDILYYNVIDNDVSSLDVAGIDFCEYTGVAEYLAAQAVNKFSKDNLMDLLAQDQQLLEKLR